VGDAAMFAERDDPSMWLSHLGRLDYQGESEWRASQSFERGIFLARRSADDIGRFVARVEELARVHAYP
jgi:hypothetical protein